VELLTKLLDNAIKFTQTTGQISIAVEHRDPQQLELTIADTGRGIEPNRLETVFDRFYQEEGALRRSRGGTGIGLAICRQIVKGWGGEIWAESPGKDQGSQFHFTIPMMTANSPTTIFSPAPSPPAAKTRSRAKAQASTTKKPGRSPRSKRASP
jgi:signal transduction histidine kinase